MKIKTLIATLVFSTALAQAMASQALNYDLDTPLPSSQVESLNTIDELDTSSEVIHVVAHWDGVISVMVGDALENHFVFGMDAGEDAALFVKGFRPEEATSRTLERGSHEEMAIGNRLREILMRNFSLEDLAHIRNFQEHRVNPDSFEMLQPHQVRHLIRILDTLEARLSV